MKIQSGMEIDGKKIAFILKQFKLLYSGWELDDLGWIVEFTDASRAIILTNHGSPYVARKSVLLDKIKEYEEVIEQTHKALESVEAK